MLLLTASAFAGSIKAEVEAAEPVRQVWAVQWTRTPTGMQSKAHEGKLEDGKLVFTDLPEEGHYNLRFATDKGIVEGWDARVPESDYVDEQPLSDADRQTLIGKMMQGFAVDFFDEAIVLDIQGNIQNAAVLLTGHRERPFAEGSGTTHGVWVWRAERWQWENPDEQGWVSYQEKPYYAMHRERLKPEEYRAKSVTFAHHLGGIELTKARPEADLGKIVVPAPRPGVHAVNRDGTPTTAVILKPDGPRVAATQPAEPDAPAADESEGGDNE